jgi:DNA-binding NarL/FixJ family response regulator
MITPRCARGCAAFSVGIQRSRSWRSLQRDEAVVLTDRLRPDVVMDLQMPGLDGVSAISRLAEGGNTARVLVLTVSHTDSDIRTAVEAGAAGYLLKESQEEELTRAVRAAARGEAVLSPSVATRLFVQVRIPAEEPLTQREVQVLGLVARGLTNRRLSRRLGIREPTVKTHLAHIYEKFGVSDRAAAVAAGYDRGILKPELPRLAW